MKCLRVFVLYSACLLAVGCAGSHHDTSDSGPGNPDGGSGNPDGGGPSGAGDGGGMGCGDGVAPEQCDAGNVVQADSDTAGGACPVAASPGDAGCSTTIYDIKSGTTPVGSNVALSDVLVTGRYADGFFLQVKETDSGYQGGDNSGIFVYAPSNTVSVGDRLDITSATTADYYGEIQLGSAVASVRSSGDSPPAPISVSASDIATGGSRAAALEGVLVKITNATVADIAPTPGVGDPPPTHEFAVDAMLRVDDLLHLITPFPLPNQNFASITGIVAFRNNNSKLEPRMAGDYVPGSATIASFGPAQVYTRVCASGVATIPQPLTVALASAVASDTFVSIASSDTNALTVVGGGVTVMAGQTSAPVLVNGLAQSLDVTLTATLGPKMATAQVRVVDASEEPAVTSLTPNPAAVPPGGMVALTVVLDIPAPTGGSKVSLEVAPSSAGGAPSSVVVAEDRLQATFDYTGGNALTTGTVTAILDASMTSTTVQVQSGPDHLVINEIDYNQGGTDANSFIEIYNGTGVAVSLANLAVVLVNGNGSTEYARFDLSGAGASLAGGGYLVIGNSTVTGAVPGGVLTIDATGDFIQNGDPDAVALIDTSSNTLGDALSYGGSIMDASITGFSGPVSLVEGTALDAATIDLDTDDTHSLVRDPNGSDSDDASADWKLTSTITPGAANTVTP